MVTFIANIHLFRISLGWWTFIFVFTFLLIAYLDARNPYKIRQLRDKNIDRYDTRTITTHVFDWMFENILLKFSDNVPEFFINIFLPIEASAKNDTRFVGLDKIYRVSSRHDRWKQFSFDLHVHTDVLDIFPSRKKSKYVKNRAQKNGLNGIACTCHNRVRFPEYGVLFTDSQFIWLTSQEITMQPPYNLKSQKRRGTNKYLNSFHCNAHGTTKKIQQTSQMSTSDVIDQIHEQNGIANFNHPSKTLIDFMPLFDTVEIWNGKRPRKDVIDYWESLYLSGIYRPGLAGSDFHSHRGRKGFSDIGIPRTIILVEELNRFEILDAIRDGRCYLTMGSIIDFWISLNDIEGDIGSNIKIHSGTIIEVNAYGIPLDNGCAKLRVNNKYTIEISLTNQVSFEINHKMEIVESTALRIDIFNENDELVLITNPIFISLEG